MALVFVDQAEVVALKALINHTAAQDLDLRLYVSNTTPDDADTEATYTEATGGGYAAISLTGASWTVATSLGVTTASYPKQTFTFTGPLTTNPTIYGYYVTQRSSGALLWAERASTTFTPLNNGDYYEVTLRVTCD